MHGMEHTKLISAQQARPVYKYKSTKEKLFKTSATIWFNKMCRVDYLTVRYIHVKTMAITHKIYHL
jgi:hypothetical protein